MALCRMWFFRYVCQPYLIFGREYPFYYIIMSKKMQAISTHFFWDGKGTSPFYLYNALYVRNIYSSLVYKNKYCILILDTYPTVMPSTDLPLVGVGSCSTSSIFVVLVLLFICSAGTTKACTTSTSSTVCGCVVCML